jgi:hypothetical protein
MTEPHAWCSHSDRRILRDMVLRSSIKAVLIALAEVCADLAQVSSTRGALWMRRGRTLVRHAACLAYRPRR